MKMNKVPTLPMSLVTPQIVLFCDRLSKIIIPSGSDDQIKTFNERPHELEFVKSNTLNYFLLLCFCKTNKCKDSCSTRPSVFST